MKTVSPPLENISKCWGKGSAQDTTYRLIRYHLQKDVDEGTLLCNTVTGELLLLDREEKAFLDTFPLPYDRKMDDLIEKHFLVPSDFDEEKEILRLRRVLTFLYKREAKNYYVILPTSACNARCFYCFEAGCKFKTMSEQTAVDTGKYVAANAKGRKVQIVWFGGEPTLAANRIDTICHVLKENDTDFRAMLITNGYLLDDALIKKAKELWNVESIQITLDGTEEVYNRVKSYVNADKSPYQRVLDNIDKALKNEVVTNIRLNFDRHNYEDLHHLIDELCARYGKNKYLRIYVHELFDDCGYDVVRHDDDDREWLASKRYELSAPLEEMGYFHPQRSFLPVLKSNACMADNDCNLVINPDGGFSKCDTDFESCLVGNVRDGVVNIENLNKWKETITFSECDDCPIFPYCVQLKRCPATKKRNIVQCRERVEDSYAAMDFEYEKFKNRKQEKEDAT